MISTAFRIYPVPALAEGEKTIHLRIDRIVPAGHAGTRATMDVAHG